MSYANGTQFYNLPQTVGNDKRDWFDSNAAFAAIDAALHSAVTGQAADAEAISTINGKLADDEADIAALQTKTTTHDSQIAALQTTVNTQASQIQDVRQDAEDMITANNEGAAATSTRAYEVGDYFIYNDVLYKATAAIAIGDTIVPNTNCEATNVDTELTQLNSDLSTKSVSVTADGVKTWGTLLTELNTLKGSSTLNSNSRIEVNGTTYNAVYHVIDTINGVFSRSLSLSFEVLRIDNGFYEKTVLTDTPTITRTFMQSEIPTSGLVLTLYFQ